MPKKFLRGIFIFAICLLSAGMLSIFGSINIQSEDKNISKVESVFSGTTIERKTNDDIVNKIVRNELNLTSVTTPNANGSLQERFAAAGYTVKLIESAANLSEFAYEVNQGTETSTNTIYFLTTDIDLSGKYWTPIGTYSHPFQGIFFGNGKTISNAYTNDVSIDLNANSGDGIFGNNTGIIANVQIFNINKGSTKTKKGSLVGDNSGYVVDCRIKQSSANTTGVLITNTSVNVGSSNITVVGNNSGNIINSKVLNANGGNFKRANNPWYEDSQIKFTTNASLSEKFDYYQIYSTSRSNVFSGFRNESKSFFTKVSRREYANENSIYAIYPNKFGNGDLSFDNETSQYKIDWESRTVEVTFDYNYGNGARNTTVSFGYDQTFKSWFDSNPKYKTRVGYDFLSLQVSSENSTLYDTVGNIYNQSYPKYTTPVLKIISTACFNWEKNSTTNFDVTVQGAKTEGGNFQLSEAGVKIDNTSLSNDNNYQTSFSNISETSKTFTLKLNDGYEILLNTYSNANSESGCNGQSIGDQSGVYVDFSSWTGVDPNYQKSGKNNDSYNPVNATITKTQNSNTYTITLNNLVGGSGNVYLSIQRVDVKVELLPNMSESGYTTSFEKSNGKITATLEKTISETTSTFTVTFSLDATESYKYLTIENGKAYLILKYKESSILTIDTNTSGNDTDLYVLSYTPEHTSLVTEENPPTMSGDSYENYYNQHKTRTFTIVNLNDTSLISSQINFYLGFLQTNIQTQFYNENGSLLNACSGNYANLKLSVNDFGDIQNSTTLVNLQNDEFVFTANGYYQVDYIDVIDLSNNNTQRISFSEIDVGDGNKQSWTNTSTRILTKFYTGEKVGSTNDYINYQINVYLATRTYDVEVKCYYQYTVNGTTQEQDISSLFDSLPSYTNQTIGVNLTLPVTMSTTGEQILVYDSCRITYGENTDTKKDNGVDYFTKNSISVANGDNFGDGSCDFNLTLGTYKTEVKLYFNFKTITINVAAESNGKWEGTSGTYKFTYSELFGQSEYVVGIEPVSAVNSLNVRADLYFQGWQVGEDTTLYNNFAIQNNPGLVAYLAAQGTSHINSNFSVDTIRPIVSNRTIEVKYYSGSFTGQISADNGNTWVNFVETSVGSIIFPATNISNLAGNGLHFKRLGYLQNGWRGKYYYTDSSYTERVIDNIGLISGNTYAISELSDWYRVFNDSANSDNLTYQDWSKVAVAADQTRIVRLSANWEAIDYQIEIDQTTSAIINLGQDIEFVSSGAKNGKATYTIGSGIYNSSVLNGYVANGFRVSHKQTATENASNPYSFNAANAKELLKTANFFAVNMSDPIVITTQRTNATYTVTIKGNEHYTINGGHNDIVQTVTFDDVYTIDGIYAREGYTLDGFVRLNDSGNKIDDFIASGTYQIASDITIMPAWVKTSNTTEAGITNIAQNQTEFYLFNEKDIFEGSIIVNGSVLEVNEILTNGEKISEFGFSITGPDGNGGTRTFNVLNDNLNLTDLVYLNKIFAGTYKIKFYISCYDSLPTKTGISNAYTVYSEEKTIVLTQNEINFNNDNDFHSIYTGTTEFVPSEENVFGTFGFNQDYSESARSYDLQGDTAYFNRFEVSGNKNVGTEKTLRLYLNASAFGELFGANLDQIFSNVNKSGSNYYIDINALTIDKAKITIAGLSNGSAFYTGEETIVGYDGKQTTFNNCMVGETTFGYKYDRVVLRSTCGANIYTGAENYSIDSVCFNVVGLEVEGCDISNFEWNIPSTFSFEIISTNDVSSYNFRTKYLTATDGILNSLSFAGNETLIVSNFKVNGNNVSNIVTRSTSQGTGYDNESNVIFGYFGNGTNNLTVYVVDPNVSYKVSVYGVEENETFQLLGFGNENSDFSSLLETYDDSQLVCNSLTDESVYAILSDVVKLTLDYNTGSHSGNGEEVFYISSSSGVDVSNPSHDYAGLVFDGYTETAEYLLMEAAQDKVVFQSTKGGDAVSLLAKWRLNSVVGEQEENEFVSFASIHGINLSVSQIAEFAALPATASISYTLAGNGFNFEAVNGNFVIQNEDGFATASMSGVYTLTATVVYSDGVQGEQTQSANFEILYNINTNIVGLKQVTTENFVFNNRNREGDIFVKTVLNGEESEQKTLISLPTQDGNTAEDGFYYTVLSQQKNLTQISLVDTYTITAHIDSRYADVFELDANLSSFEIEVEKFEIVLSDYQEQIKLEKYWGDIDPDLEWNIIIENNANDIVRLAFTRDAGDDLGDYALHYFSMMNGEDSDNYYVTTNGFDQVFKVLTPPNALLVRFNKEITFTYNGKGVTDFDISYDMSQHVFVLSAMNNGQVLGSTNVEIYYLDTNTNPPTTQNLVVYSGQLIVSCEENKNIGTYDINIEINNGTTWDEVRIINSDKAKVIIEKRSISITKIQKTFDRTDEISQATEVLFDNDVSGDNLFANGKFASAMAGENISVSDIILTGADAGNYNLTNNIFGQGKILPKNVSSISFSTTSSVEYGNISNSSTIEEILILVGNYTILGDISKSDILNGFITYNGWSAQNNAFSSSDKLKASQSQTIKVFFSSDNFVGLDGNGYDFVLKIAPKQIDLSNEDTDKFYDKTTALPADMNTDISSQIIDGDLVTVDRGTSGYSTSNVGKNIDLSIVLEGVDADNYEVLPLKGEIKLHNVKFIVNATTEHSDLVTDGTFVDDRQIPTIRKTSFEEKYPTNKTAAEILQSFVYPTRIGYLASGWKYFDGANYVLITESNVLNLLENVSLGNEDVQTTIYTVWEINQYNIMVNGDNVESFVVTGDKVTGNSQNEYAAQYFSDICVSVTGEKGFKVTNFTITSGSYTSKGSQITGENVGKININNLQSDISINVSLSDINVTINFDFNLPQWTQRKDSNALSATYSYSTLKNMTKNDMPAFSVTSGTYNLENFVYGNNDKTLAEQKISEVVDELIPNLESDSSITLKANWVGQVYNITFDPQGGTLQGDVPTTVIYGQQLPQLPQAVKTGKSYSWKDSDGNIYESGDFFKTIGIKNGNVWEITFRAVYANLTYRLTVNLGQRISARIYGVEISDGQEFDITYEEDILNISILPEQGYTFAVDEAGLDAIVSVEENGLSVQNLLGNGVLTIYSTPRINTLTLLKERFASVSIEIDGIEITPEEETNVYKINATTGSEVSISLVAAKGTAFSDNLIVLSGSGRSEFNLSEFNKKANITWNNFIDDATMKINLVLADNTISYGDLRDIFESFAIDGYSMSTAGGNIKVKTNHETTVTGVLKYGLKDATLSLPIDCQAIISSQNNEFNEIDRKYHFSATIENIDDDFSLSFANQKRSYKFEIVVNPEQEDVGQITVASLQTVEFGQNITLGQNVVDDLYVFLNWTIGGDIVSTQSEVQLEIDSTISTLLERTPFGERIVVSANYKQKIDNISFIAGTKGAFTVSQEGADSFEVLNGQTVTRDVKVGANITLLVNADDGYEFDQFYIDGIAQETGSYQYDSITHEITYYLPVYNDSESISITFKASDAYVYIDAALLVNFTINKPSTEAGKVYLSDANGDMFDESLYLQPREGDLEIGGNYAFLTKTDSTIYLVAQPKIGFIVSFSNPTRDCVLNEYKVGNIIVHSFSGVKNGTQIEAVFAAKQNNLNIVFAEEGSTESLNAGRIKVDTTSAAIRASGNDSSNVMISIITGESASVVISTNFTYRFDMNEFGVKYFLHKEDSDGVLIPSVIQATTLNPIATGLTGRISFTIENIDTDGTLYIYVKPEKYNLKFYLGEDQSVTAYEILQYGKGFSLSSLTREQKDIVFAGREDYTLDGFYTKELGQGRKYVDGIGNTYGTWLESGIEFNGFSYSYNSNYDYETKTFTVYPYWVYNKANIYAETTPDNILTDYPNLTIQSIITNYDRDISWISPNDKWFMQVKIKNQLNIRALDFDGYVFKYWLVAVNGGTPIEKSREFSITLEKADYNLIAVYYPVVNIKMEDIDHHEDNIGNFSLIQDNVYLIENSYNPQKNLVIEITPKAGYDLVTLKDLDTGIMLNGAFDERTGKTRFVFEQLIARPLNLKVSFEGKNVKVTIDYENLERYHHIQSVKLNGQEIDYSAQFNAKVGDELTLQIAKSFGYLFEINGADFEISESGNIFVVKAKLTTENLILVGNYYEMNISFDIGREEILFNVSVIVEDEQAGESLRVARASFVAQNQRETNLSSGGEFRVLYGEDGILYISANKNYRIANIYMKPVTYTINNFYDGEKIEINKNFINANIIDESNYQLNIEIKFERLVWTMTEYRSDGLNGEGTEENPYLVNSEADMAFVAYAVNNRVLTEGGIPYADCYFKLNANLDFDGKYFEPIGNKENPFNGTLDLGAYSVRNVLHYKLYIDPTTKANGLVWCVTENAKIIMSNNVLIVSVSIIGGTIGVAGLTAGIIFGIKRKRRRLIAKI